MVEAVAGSNPGSDLDEVEQRDSREQSILAQVGFFKCRVLLLLPFDAKSSVFQMFSVTVSSCSSCFVNWLTLPDFMKLCLEAFAISKSN